MQDMLGSLGGFRGVRAELLVTLKKEQPLTASELATRFGLTANALRRHLKVLEEDGVVRYSREVRGVGAPVFAYRLTESGEAIFPRRYASVLVSALEALQAERGGRSVARVLAREWDALATDAGPVLDGLPLTERVQLVAELLTSRGYMAESAPSTTDGASLRIHNCAVCEIAEQFPEACEVEARQLARLLQARVTRRAHRRDGGALCAYEIDGDGDVEDETVASQERQPAGQNAAHTESDPHDSSIAGATAPVKHETSAWHEEQA